MRKTSSLFRVWEVRNPIPGKLLVIRAVKHFYNLQLRISVEIISR